MQFALAARCTSVPQALLDRFSAFGEVVIKPLPYADDKQLDLRVQPEHFEAVEQALGASEEVDTYSWVRVVMSLQEAEEFLAGRIKISDRQLAKYARQEARWLIKQARQPAR